MSSFHVSIPEPTMTRIGVISDTHDQVQRTDVAVEILIGSGAEMLIHCGDLSCIEILAACEPMPTWFVFGNHDADNAGILKRAAPDFRATCLGWGGAIEVDERQIAVAHGHLTSDLRPLIEAKPDFLLTGHSHQSADWTENEIHRVNPGALHRASKFTVAVLEPSTGEATFIAVPR